MLKILSHKHSIRVFTRKLTLIRLLIDGCAAARALRGAKAKTNFDPQSKAKARSTDLAEVQERLRWASRNPGSSTGSATVLVPATLRTHSRAPEFVSRHAHETIVTPLKLDFCSHVPELGLSLDCSPRSHSSSSLGSSTPESCTTDQYCSDYFQPGWHAGTSFC
jgi:hypothetical protein